MLLTPEQLPTTLIKSLTPVLGVQYWFVSAYISLLVISPVLNRVISSLTSKGYAAAMSFLLILSLWPLYTSRGAYWNSFMCVVLMLLALSFNYVALSRTPVASWFGWLSQAKDGIRCIPLILAAMLFLFVKEVRLPRFPFR